LYTLNTGDGSTALVGAYGVNENVVGLAFAPIPEPASLVGAGVLGALALSGRLWNRRRAARA
jgi:hypothetical protein